MVRDYCTRLSDLPFGFHGHNNLGLANANAFIAKENGASVVDCSLLGLGRSAGNTSTEEFIAINQNMGELEYIDLLGLIDLSEKYVRQHLNNIHRQPLDLICGLVGFHSSYMPNTKVCE